MTHYCHKCKWRDTCSSQWGCGDDNFEDSVVLGRDDTITFTKGDIEVYHQPEEHVIYDLSMKKGNLLSVEIKV